MSPNDGSDDFRSGFAGFLRSITSWRTLEFAVVALFLSVAVVETIHHTSIAARDDFFARMQHALVRAIRNEPPRRTVVQGQNTDPIITGSIPDQ